jgi:hypothetical protein
LGLALLCALPACSSYWLGPRADSSRPVGDCIGNRAVEPPNIEPQSTNVGGVSEPVLLLTARQALLFGAPRALVGAALSVAPCRLLRAYDVVERSERAASAAPATAIITMLVRVTMALSFNTIGRWRRRADHLSDDDSGNGQPPRSASAGVEQRAPSLGRDVEPVRTATMSREPTPDRRSPPPQHLSWSVRVRFLLLGV